MALEALAPSLEMVEALGVEREEAMRAVSKKLQEKLLHRIDQMSARAMASLLEQSTPHMGDPDIAPVVHKLIELTPPPLPSHVIEAIAADDGRLLASLPVGVKRCVIEAAPHRFMSELHPLILSYIHPQKHARSLADVLGTSKIAPAARRAACKPLESLITLVGNSESSYRHLLLLLRDIFRNTGDELVASLRNDALMAMVDLDKPELNLPLWDIAHTLIVCLDLCCRKGEVDRRTLRQIVGFLTAAGLPSIADLPPLAPPTSVVAEPPKKKARGPGAGTTGKGHACVSGRGSDGRGCGQAGVPIGGDQTVICASSIANSEPQADDPAAGEARAAETESRRIRLADAAMVLASCSNQQMLARAAILRIEAIIDAAAHADPITTFNPAIDIGSHGPLITAAPAATAAASSAAHGTTPGPSTETSSGPDATPAPTQAIGLPILDAELCALVQLLLLPTQAPVLLGGAVIEPTKWERSVFTLLLRRIPLLTTLIVDERLHKLALTRAEDSGEPLPPLPPPSATLKKAIGRDTCTLRLLLLHTLRCFSGTNEARATQLLWMVGSIGAIRWDAHMDFVRSLVAVAVGKISLLTPTLSDALLIGFFVPVSSRSERVHRRLLVLVDKCATHFRHIQPGQSVRYGAPEAMDYRNKQLHVGHEETSLLRETLSRVHESGRRDEDGAIDREYARLKILLPELAG